MYDELYEKIRWYQSTNYKNKLFDTKVFGIIHTLLIHTSAVVVCIETLGPLLRKVY